MTDFVAALRELRAQAEARLMQHEDYRVLRALDRAIAEIEAPTPLSPSAPAFDSPTSDLPFAPTEILPMAAAPAENPHTVDLIAERISRQEMSVPIDPSDDADTPLEFLPEGDSGEQDGLPADAHQSSSEALAADPERTSRNAPPPADAHGDVAAGDETSENTRLADLAAGLSAIGAALDNGVDLSESLDMPSLTSASEAPDETVDTYTPSHDAIEGDSDQHEAQVFAGTDAATVPSENPFRITRDSIQKAHRETEETDRVIAAADTTTAAVDITISEFAPETEDHPFERSDVGPDDSDLADAAESQPLAIDTDEVVSAAETVLDRVAREAVVAAAADAALESTEPLVDQGGNETTNAEGHFVGHDLDYEPDTGSVLAADEFAPSDAPNDRNGDAGKASFEADGSTMSTNGHDVGPVDVEASVESDPALMMPDEDAEPSDFAALFQNGDVTDAATADPDESGPIERIAPRDDAYEAALNRLNNLIDRASKQLRTNGTGAN